MAPDVPTRDPLLGQSAAELARRIARGELSASDVVERHLARIAAVEPQIHAVAVPLFDQARREAKAADIHRSKGQPLPPLFGVLRQAGPSPPLLR